MKEIARISMLLILAILYYLMPFDLIPDKFGRIGKLDDLAFLLIVLWWSFFKPLYEEIRQKGKQNQNADKRNENYSHAGQNKSYPGNSAKWAYELLEVSPSDSIERIKKAYHSKMQQYHPDLVANLGPELKDLAHQKTAQINAAFEHIKKELL